VSRLTHPSSGRTVKSFRRADRRQRCTCNKMKGQREENEMATTQSPAPVVPAEYLEIVITK